jgi:hypothetical protein
MRQRLGRGGFFKKLFKGVGRVVKTVKHVPVIGALAKTAIKSLPVLGNVVSAVDHFKKKTAAGAGHHSHPSNPSPSQAHNMATHAPKKRGPKRAKAAKRPKRAKRAKRAKAARKGGGSAKQKAARARFAAAARKGKIRKGQRL